MKTISSIHNDTIQHLIGLSKNSDYRKECKSLLLEGRNAIIEVGKKLGIKRLIVTDNSFVPPELNTEVVVVTDAIMNKLSSVKTSQGMIAELPFPTMEPLHKKKKIVALDRVRDPGNLGTLLRTALALGWEGVFFLPGCCDPFGDKALRSAKGATFHIPLQMGSWQDLEDLVTQNGLTPLVADFWGTSQFQELKDGKCVLILGNEGEGVHIPSTLSHTVISIPTTSDMASLNVSVAGGILMYVLQGNV